MKAKKSLGQNFLKSAEALREIILAGDLKAGDVVLEVGPGRGALTEKILGAGANVIAIEKDHELIPVLEEKFKKEIEDKRLEIIEKDILEYEQVGEHKIIANIPYYITGTFLQKFLETENQPEKMVLMLQKEVAQRIVAKDSKESILSISVKAYGVPKYVMTVKAKYFSPAPNVDSAVIAINNISKKFFTDFTEKDFFRIIKAGFAHKRKMLAGNLSALFPKEKILEAFQKINLNEKTRAEDLVLEEWRKLISILN